MAEEKGDDHKEDGTVDLKGRPVLRSKTGCWKGCLNLLYFRIAYHGVASNLVLYFAKKPHEGTVTSSNHVTNRAGDGAPDIGGVSSGAEATVLWAQRQGGEPWVEGLNFPTSLLLCSLCDCARERGYKAQHLKHGGRPQFDDFEPKEKTQKMSFFNRWMFTVFTGSLLAHTVVVYIQDNDSWGMGYGIQTIGLGLGIWYW
ncbi:protein NRT1/ PTR FAMILY 5.2-like [Punica granatum]|uniref:Protein NRT1/ PTR FAMILY 5.2-like n=1 Tax=Punica granatum TaxID=22663 RepID=A0A6P8BWX5_PUNGR|nr:protein NRT1/ PTR FAMILY 5.2-like [Punica granatum]